MLTERVKETVNYIQEKTQLRPRIAVILGSGLGAFAEELEEATVIPYGEIPNFMVSTAPGHNGCLVIGRREKKDE